MYSLAAEKVSLYLVPSSSAETGPIHDIVIRDTALPADSELSSIPFVLAYA